MNLARKDAKHLLAHLTNGEREVVGMIAKRQSLEEITRKFGLPKRTIEGMIHSARFAFGANDDLVDDYLLMLEDWQQETGSELYFSFGEVTPEEDALIASDEPPDKSRVIDEIAATMSTNEMRELGGSLLRLADAFDQGWSPENVRSSFHWPSGAARIEKKALELAKRAKVLIRHQELRERFLPQDLFGEPAWNILLDLFIQFSGGAKVSGKSLCIAAKCPPTTALRHIARLEDAGLIKREAAQHDGRVSLYSLTKQGLIGVGRALEHIGA